MYDHPLQGCYCVPPSFCKFPLIKNFLAYTRRVFFYISFLSPSCDSYSFPYSTCSDHVDFESYHYFSLIHLDFFIVLFIIKQNWNIFNYSSLSLTFQSLLAFLLHMRVFFRGLIHAFLFVDTSSTFSSLVVSSFLKHHIITNLWTFIYSHSFDSARSILFCTYSIWFFYMFLCSDMWCRSP